MANELDKKKVAAYELLRRIYASVAETKRLQEELTRIENEIAGLEKKDGDT